MESPYILILFHSRHGSVLNLARAIAKGVESQGLEAKLRCPNEEGQYPQIVEQDLVNCAGLAMGSPCYFGMMSSELKAFWEATSTQWFSGALIDKPACVFTSSSSMHGGNEATLLSMSLPLLHHGMLLLGIPYSEPALNETVSGGSPYGASHVSQLTNQTDLSTEERELCIALGQRLAKSAIKLA